MRNVDQKKHDVDVMERVLAGARAASGHPDTYTTLVDVEVHPWLGGSTSSAATLTVGILAEHAR